MALNFLDKQFDKLKGVTPENDREPRQSIAAGQPRRMGFLPPSDDAVISPEPERIPDKLEPRVPSVGQGMVFGPSEFPAAPEPTPVTISEGEWENVRTREVITHEEKNKRYPKGYEAELDEWVLSASGRKGLGDRISLFGKALTKVPRQTAAAILQAVQGHGGATVVDRDWADRFIADAQSDINKFVAETEAKYGESKSPIKMTDIAQLPQNIAFSLTSMGVGVGIGAPLVLVPLPGARVAAYAAGSAASGAVAYSMTTYQIMQQYLEVKDAEIRAVSGRGMTPDEEKKLKADFESAARKYGLWEAVPEAISNLAFAKILLTPLTNMVGKGAASAIVQKLVGMYGQEFLTETITQKGQAGIEAKAGLREGPVSWGEAFKEIAPQTFLLTTIMGGAGQGGVFAYNKIKASLKKEVGENHPRYNEILEQAKRWVDGTSAEGPMVPPSVQAVQGARAELTPEVTPTSREEFTKLIKKEMGVPVPIDYEEINWHESGFHVRNKQPWLTIGTEGYPENVDQANFEKLITLHEYWHYMMRGQKPSVEAEAVTWDKVVGSAKRFGVNTEGVEDIIKGFHPEYGEGAINKLMKSIAPEIVGQQASTFKGYNDAQVAMQGQSKNFIVQPKPVADVNKRNLFVQISSQVNAAEDAGKEYSDLLYSGILDRPADFWEVPTWIAEASYTMPNSDVLVVRNITEAEKTLAKSKYARIFLSVMDVNKEDSVRLAKAFPGQVIVGGYVDKGTFKGVSNVTYADSLEQATALAGGKYKQGVSYVHFAGVPTVPRLCMSKGCLHKCAFCAVSKEKIGPTSKAAIDQQVRAIAKLDPKLVYLDDKTFGQAENYKYLKDINDSLSHSPNFEGFIVQTTAPQIIGLDDEFLIDSNIKFVEIGVESYNDAILRAVHKPARVSSIDKATDKLRKLGISFVPNILVGLPNETAETYANTMAFLEKNADIISHVNVYNLAVYEGTDISKEVGIKIASDANENMVEKSFRPDTELDRKFGEDVMEFAKAQIRKAVGLTKIKKLDELVLIHAKEGGLTYNVAEGHEPRKFGFAVSLSKEYEAQVKGRYITRRDLEKFIAKNNVMLSDPAYNLGTWYNEETDLSVIDISRIVADESRALVLGRAHGQVAIYDIVNDEAIRIEPATEAGGAVPPIEPPIPPETLIEAAPPFKESGKDIVFAPLQDAQTVIDYSAKPDVSRWIANLPGVKQLMSKLNPSIIADTPWAKAIIARAVMREEGTSKSLGLTSYRDAVGGEKKLFGRDHAGFMTKGDLKGMTLGDIIQSPSKIKGKLTTAQAEWISRTNELTRAYRKYAADNDIKINELTFEEGGEYAGRKVYARFSSDGELLESAHVGAGPSRIGGKLTPQKGRVFATEEEAIRNGYRYLAYSEAQALNIRALYNRVADQNMSGYILTQMPWRTTGAPEELVLAAESSRTRLHHSQQLLAAINRAVRGERVPTSTLNSIAKSYPEEALELQLAITEIQANRPTADSIQALERSAKLAIKSDKADNYAAINARARARERAMTPGFGDITLRHPAFAGKVFTGPDAKKLETAMREVFEPNVNEMLTSVNKVNAIVRYFKLAGDISPLAIQLIFLAGSNPVIYGGAAASIPKMLFDPTWISKLLAKNKDLIDRHPGVLLSSSGNEFTEAMAKGGMLSVDLDVWPKQEGVLKKLAKLPFRVVGKVGAMVLQPWQRVFEGLVDYSGLKMMESLEHIAKTPAETAEVDQYINEFRGLTSSAKLGVGPNWRAVETATLLAPRYNRAIAALLYDAIKGALTGGQSGIRSRLAIQGLTKGILAISAMTVALSMALGEDEEDIKEHFDPNSTRFFTWNIAGTNIGPGTKLRSIIKLIAQVQDNPEALMQMSMDNPALRFLRGNLAPVLGGAINLLTGKDYIGDPVRSDAATFAREMIVKNFLPIWVENVLYEGGSLSQRLLRGAGEFFGGRTYPETESDQVTRLRERYSGQDYGKEYEELNNEERNALRRKHDDLSEIEEAAKKEYAEKGSDVERFYYNEKERITDARNSKLNEAAQAYLDGSITKYDYDKQRAYIRPYYSGGREVLWSVKESLDEYSVGQMEKWIDENIKPEDKALGEYQEYRGSLIEGAELPVDWDLVERELTAKLSQYPSEIQSYITANLNSWINDLPPAAKQVEEERTAGIEDESWWKDYRGKATPTYRPNIPTTQPRKSIDDIFSGLKDSSNPADSTNKRIDDVFSAFK